MTRRLLAVVCLIPAVLTACTFPLAGADPGPTSPTPTSSTSPGTGKAITAALRQVRVLGERPEVASYRRDQFGRAWTDDHSGLGGHNGCDTRNDVLAAQLQAPQYRGKPRCVVIAGTLLVDPYTGKRLAFRKETAAEIQIDHIYPLSRAWDMGASRWPKQRRIDFANDEATNLIAVDGPANASKGDSGPGEWMPINRNYRCTYALRYLQVARKWSLPITTADRNSVKSITHLCP